MYSNIYRVYSQYIFKSLRVYIEYIINFIYNFYNFSIFQYINKIMYSFPLSSIIYNRDYIENVAYSIDIMMYSIEIILYQ
jgi:hypothetical protein